MNLRPVLRRLIVPWALRSALLFSLAALVGGGFWLSTPGGAATVCQALSARTNELPGLRLTLGTCSVDPLGLSVRVRPLQVEAQHGLVVFSVDEVRVALWGALPGAVSFGEVALVQPRVDILLPEVLEGAGAAPAGCPLDALQSLRISRLDIEEGALRVRQGQRWARLDGFSLRSKVRYESTDLELSARAGAVGLPDGKVVQVRRLAAELKLSARQRELQVLRADLDVEGIRALASGTLEALCEPSPRVALSAQLYLPMSSLPRLGVDLPGAAGELWARLGVSGRLLTPVLTAQVKGNDVALLQFTPGDFELQAALEGGTVSIESFTTAVGVGEVRARGTLSLTDRLPLDVEVETSRASLGEALDRAGVPGPWVDAQVSARTHLTGTLTPAPKLAGEVTFEAAGFRLGAQPFNQEGLTILTVPPAGGRFELEINEDHAAFLAARAQVLEGVTRATADVRVYFDPYRGFEVDAELPEARLEELKAIVELPWEGRGNAQVKVKGNFLAVGVQGDLRLSDFVLMGYGLGVVQSPVTFSGTRLSFPSIVAQKGRTGYVGACALDFAPGGPVALEARAAFPDGRLEDVAELLVRLSSVMPAVRDRLTGRLTGELVASGGLPRVDLTVEALVSEAAYAGRRLGGGPVVLALERGEALVLRPAELKGALGVTRGEGRWVLGGPLDFRFSVPAAPLDELVNGDTPGPRTPLDGPVALEARVSGTAERMIVDATAVSPRVTFRGASLGQASLKARLVGSDMEVTGQPVPGVDLEAQLAVADGWPYEASARLDVAELARFLPEGSGLTGALQGTVKARGLLFEPAASQLEADLKRLDLQWNGVQASNTEPVQLAWDKGALKVEHLVLAGPTTSLRAEGRWGPTTADLRTQGRVDLRLAPAWLPQLERPSGEVTFSASITGKVESPAILGSGDVVGAGFTVAGWPVTLRGLNAHLDFSENRVLVQDGQALINDGRLGITGELDLERLSLVRARLRGQVQDVNLELVREAPATFNGALQADWRREGVTVVSGPLEVTRLKYAQPLQLEDLLARARRGLPSDARPKEWLRYDVDLSTGPEVRVENNLLKARLVGRMKLGGTNVRPTLTGVLESQVGGQAYFRASTLAVNRGLLQFTGSGLFPQLDLALQTSLRDYVVSVKAFGKLEDPKVALSAEPPLSEADILSLLTLGITSREALRSTSAAGGLVAETLMTASGLDQQLQRFLTRNLGLKDQQVRLTTTFNEITGTAEPSVTWEAKMLNESLRLGITQPVTGRGTRAQAEYRFNPRLSARAQWDNNQQQTSNAGNPGVDLRLRFEWE